MTDSGVVRGGRQRRKFEVAQDLREGEGRGGKSTIEKKASAFTLGGERKKGPQNCLGSPCTVLKTHCMKYVYKGLVF